MASDEVTDMIAHIEMQRQDKAKTSGVAAACGEALRKLQSLLESERAALQANGSDAEQVANVEVVTAEIARIKRLASGTKPNSTSKTLRPGRQHVSRPVASPARNKGRRTMGRRGPR